MNYGRLFGHDYTKQGFYMVTLVTEPRRALFSSIKDGRVVRTPAGDALQDAWLKLGEEAPSISLEASAIMPDHFHGTLVVKDGGGKSLDWHVSRLKGRVTHAVRKLENNTALQVWEVGFHDWVSLNAEMFRAFKNYVSDNPKRWQLRHDNRALFMKHQAVTHWRLGNTPCASDGAQLPGGNGAQLPGSDGAQLPGSGGAQLPGGGTCALQWSAMGDMALLDYPMLMPIIISRKTTGSALNAEISRIIDAVKNGAVPISGFISPGEREVLKSIVLLPRTRLICMLPYGMTGYKPNGLAVEAIATSKMLVLSAFPASVPPSPISYENCHANNALAQAIAGSSS